MVWRIKTVLVRKPRGLCAYVYNINVYWAGASCAALACAHACFDDVDDIVAQLLTLVDDVHVDGSDGVVVEVVVDVVDVLRLELVAVVVDFVLDVERAVDVERVLPAAHELVHLREGGVG
jgi:hypothetical protein